MDVKKSIEERKIIAIIRKVYGDDLLKLSQALYDGGISMLEITFDQADRDCVKKTSQAIANLKNKMGDALLLGAGTVLSVEQVDAAARVGAQYIISPNTDEAVIRRSKERGLVSMPGAITPSEMVFASQCGADFIKAFPAADLGLNYMKSIMSPLSHLKFMAVGGVSTENLKDMLRIGFVGAGIGSFLSDKKLITSGDYDAFTSRARGLMEIAMNQ